MKIVLFALALLAPIAMAHMAGGWSKKPVNDEQVVAMAAFAVPHLQADIDHHAVFKLSSIESAEAQVVSGMNYRIVMILEETTHDRATYNNEDSSEFETAPDAKKVKCTVNIYDQPWTGRREISEKSCDKL